MTHPRSKGHNHADQNIGQRVVPAFKKIMNSDKESKKRHASMYAANVPGSKKAGRVEDYDPELHYTSKIAGYVLRVQTGDTIEELLIIDAPDRRREITCIAADGTIRKLTNNVGGTKLTDLIRDRPL